MTRVVLATVMIWSLLLSPFWQTMAFGAEVSCCLVTTDVDMCFDGSENAATATASSCCALSDPEHNEAERDGDSDEFPGCPKSSEQCPCRCCQRVPVQPVHVLPMWGNAVEQPMMHNVDGERATPFSRSLRPPSPPPKFS